MIRKAELQDIGVVTQLALGLWLYHDDAQLREEMEQILSLKDAAIFLACDEQVAVGFAQCQLRRDYVEGTETSPVGYLEGIYVEEAYRGRGYAKQLLHSCECWAKELGCSEFASDCELDNVESLCFHLKVGFTEVNRIICFSKKL